VIVVTSVSPRGGRCGDRIRAYTRTDVDGPPGIVLHPSRAVREVTRHQLVANEIHVLVRGGEVILHHQRRYSAEVVSEFRIHQTVVVIQPCGPYGNRVVTLRYVRTWRGFGRKRRAKFYSSAFATPDAFYSREAKRPPSPEFIPIMVGTSDSCL